MAQKTLKKVVIIGGVKSKVSKRFDIAYLRSRGIQIDYYGNEDSDREEDI